MYSSKITSNGNKSLNRLDCKSDYIEELLCNMRGNTETGSHLFKSLLSLDEELRNDMGFCSGKDRACDKDNLNWYEEKIRKNLNKLDIITLTFLLNAIDEATGV